MERAKWKGKSGIISLYMRPAGRFFIHSSFPYCRQEEILGGAPINAAEQTRKVRYCGISRIWNGLCCPKKKRYKIPDLFFLRQNVRGFFGLSFLKLLANTPIWFFYNMTFQGQYEFCHNFYQFECDSFRWDISKDAAIG